MATIYNEKQAPLERHHVTNNERKIKAIERVGHTVNLAIERFMTIGEIIAEDNPEIKSDMSDFCKDARDAGKSIERLCGIPNIGDVNYPGGFVESLWDRGAIVIAARSLLSSITRVLLLVDIIVVKQLLNVKKNVTKSLGKLESVINFTEFVRAFSVFGIEMIELANLTGNQHNGLKEERRRAQMYSARQILERSITILLTSSKTSLVHYDCIIAKENRDTVFCQIRRAMDLIHFVIKDSIFDSAWLSRSGQSTYFRGTDKETVYSTLKQFSCLMESFRHKPKNINSSTRSICNMGNNNHQRLVNTYPINYEDRNCLHIGSDTDQKPSSGNIYMQESTKSTMWPSHELPLLYSADIHEQLLLAFDKLMEKTQDFTDSAYTSHENRENILLLCERCKLELNKYLSNIIKSDQYAPTVLIDEEIECVLLAVKHLSEQLVSSVADQVVDLNHSLKMSVDLVSNFHTMVFKQDLDRLQEYANRFHDYCDHIIDVCKLLRHIAFTETLQVQAKCLSINLRIYGPQVLTAAKIISKYPSSIPANENFNAFIDMWKWLTSEISTLAKNILESKDDFEEPKLGLTSLPENCEIAKNSLQPYQPDQEELNKNAFTGLDDKSNEVNPYNEKWNDTLNDNNDILKRAKNMSAMAFSMYQFTKGNGTLRTTQDLFTQAEYFAEEANRLYKVLRQFSYQVPASQNKKELLNILDRVPTFVQTLQFTVKDHTVGKAATFVKVDHVIRETKNLMGVINKVVTKCFECADKYKLDFTGLSGGITSGSARGEDNSSGGMCDSKGTSNNTEGSM